MFKKKITTLYIDDTKIKVLVARGTKVKKYAEITLDAGLIEGMVVMNEAEVAARIRKLLKDNRINTRKIILGISGMHCFTRPITLPQLPKNLLPEAIMRVAGSTLPLSLDQLYLIWHAIPAPAGKTQVFLAALRRQSADSLLRTLQQARLKPTMIDIKPLALARLVRSFTAVIIDIQPAEFDIVVMVEGIPQPIRTIPFPREELSWEAKFTLIKNDVERTLQFYNANNPEKPLGAGIVAYVSGEMAKQDELCQLLSRELGLPVSVLPSRVETDGPEFELVPLYMVNVGLLFKEPSLSKHAGPSIANINFLPQPYRPKPIPVIKAVALPATIIVGLLIVPVFVLLQGATAEAESLRGQIDSTNSLIIEKQKERQGLTSGIAQLQKDVQKTQSSAANFTAVLEGFGTSHEMVNGDLGLAVSTLDAGMSLTRVNHTDEILEISGNAPDESAILNYSRSLDASGRFAEITVASLQRGEKGMNFTLVLKVSK